MLIQLLLITLLQDSPKAEPGEVSGKVVGIADGDTLTILTAEKKQIKIRFNGIDAPERGQPFGTKSKDHLSHMVGGKSVRIVTHGEDRYDRTIGEVFVAGEKPEDSERNVNAAMVADGFAWHYVFYAPDNKELAEAEKIARKDKRGLWVDASPVSPWDWRKLSKEERDKLR
jgi:endonuclease YncB( thermonuclease family)